MLALAFIINIMVAAWLYPEVFVHVDLRMVQGHETGGPMQYVFYLIGLFYQGGVQLFNRYDLFNTSFTQLSVGLYTPFNVIIAFGYVLLAPFVDNPAQFFHHWYVIAYYGLGLLLRTYGLYLLTFYMTKSRLTALITSVLVNCFCAITLIHMGGVCIAEVYNYLPLLLFCLVYYWDTRSFKSIIAAILIFLLAANNSLYVGLGYFYQTLHLFLFDMLVIWLIFQRNKKPLLADRFNWGMTAKALLVSVIILLPVVWWGFNLASDFEVFGSGIGGTQGRFTRIYNPVAMLNDTNRFFVSSADVFKHAYDFTTSGWYLSGAFLGITTMILSVIGLVLGKHSYKYIFISAAVMMAFLNVPSQQGGWMMWAHWIDAITNPFCFLVRSFHYSVLLWYLTMAIPMCLGVEAILALINNNRERIYAKRIIWLKLASFIGLVGSLWIPQDPIKFYALKIFALFFIFFMAFDQRIIKLPRPAWLAGFILIMIFFVEFSVLKTYINTQSVDMNQSYWDGLRVKPRIFAPMHTPPIPMVLDYQNPKILPFRFFYRTDKQVIFPLVQEFQGMFGDFYRYVPLALRLERPSSMYIPRLKIFQGIDKDAQIQEYLRRDGRMMYFADVAIKPNNQDYAYVLDNNLDRRIIQIEEAHTHKVQDFSNLDLPQALPVNFKQRAIDFDLSKARMHKKSNGIEYQWALPKDFPRYLSTAVFTNDAALWQMTVDQQALMITQGALVTPLTFDVNNIRDGYVTVLMPLGQPLVQEKIILRVFMPEEIIDVWHNSQDQMGITLDVKRDSWWVMHLPYDPKWQLSIDGVKTPIAKVNRYFIGVPLTAGEHQLLLTYWPHSPLRILIIISVLAAIVLMGVVFYWTYKWYK